MDKPEQKHVYKDLVCDSARWEHFKVRRGDIIVATPAKCGTTWTQMICALLVHQTKEFPQPLTVLSRWLDRDEEAIEDVVAHFEAQPFRRIIKTHTPLDALPYYEEATYVFCGRDPRDVFLSGMDHLANASQQTKAAVRKKAGMDEDIVLPTDPNALFPVWLTTGLVPWMNDGFPIGSIQYLTQTYWRFRHLPNIVFLHYGDMTENLDAEMRRLSLALGIPVDEAKWPTLVAAAGFAAMKGDADRLAPGAHLGEWSDNSDFFRKARQGEWREHLSADNLALYERVTSERLEPELKAWLERGRFAADPTAA